MKAVWNGQIIAESVDTVVVENNHYFPPESLNKNFFKPSSDTTVCFWKGTASYFDVVVNGQTNPGSAWYYSSPNPPAENIKGRVAFWKGIKVIP
jgi:uncharacterized protein (DUF427 family)